MASKQITEVYNVFTAASMSGTSTIYGVPTAIKYRDSVSYQFDWTGDPSGEFFVQGSLNYAPGLPQSAEPEGGVNPGTWNIIPLTPAATIGSGSNTYLLNLADLGVPYIRPMYTNTGSQGSLTGLVFCKSYGA